MRSRAGPDTASSRLHHPPPRFPPPRFVGFHPHQGDTLTGARPRDCLRQRTVGSDARRVPTIRSTRLYDGRSQARRSDAPFFDELRVTVRELPRRSESCTRNRQCDAHDNWARMMTYADLPTQTITYSALTGRPV